MEPNSGGNRQSQVTEQMNDIEKYLSVLSENIDSLFIRLEKVLKQQPPESSKDQGTVLENLVPHAIQLRGFGGSIKKLSNEISDLVNRLEI